MKSTHSGGMDVIIAISTSNSMAPESYTNGMAQTHPQWNKTVEKNSDFLIFLGNVQRYEAVEALDCCVEEAVIYVSEATGVIAMPNVQEYGTRLKLVSDYYYTQWILGLVQINLKTFYLKRMFPQWMGPVEMGCADANGFQYKIVNPCADIHGIMSIEVYAFDKTHPPIAKKMKYNV